MACNSTGELEDFRGAWCGWSVLLCDVAGGESVLSVWLC